VRSARQQPQPADQARAVPAPGRWADDIIELIMADHRRIRRLCQALDDAARQAGGPAPGWMLAHTWQRLASVLQAHAWAQEEICYLPMFGSGPQAARRRRAAGGDHDDIREAISEASLQPVGSSLWWQAVRAALAATARHLGREEHAVVEGLTGLTMRQRRELGRQWSAFIAAWTLDEPRAGRAGQRRRR
jgi:Hemerythrin HHE cation binding domain